MSFFYHLEHNDAKEQRIAQRLLHLKAGLKAHGLPARNLDESLLIATWNIRDFDTDAYGRRDREALSYMAEIISHFDLVAVQEVKRDLRAFNRLMELLGGWWKCILTDTTEGKQGNEERMAFIFDSRKLRFGGLAGEVVVPPVEDSRGRMLEPSKQLYRTPFIAGFKAGWFNFMICTAHIMYGKSTANDRNREAEIRALAQLLARRTQGEHAWSKNLILLGDFNIFKPSDVTFDAITDAGFFIPEKLQSLPSNAIKNKHYDQIAFLAPDLENHVAQSKAGVFDFYDYVYRKDEELEYIPDMGDSYYRNSRGKLRSDSWKTRYYNSYWRTQQMSDHLPMWIEIKTDFGEEYLRSKTGQSVGHAAPVAQPEPVLA